MKERDKSKDGLEVQIVKDGPQTPLGLWIEELLILEWKMRYSIRIYNLSVPAQWNQSKLSPQTLES